MRLLDFIIPAVLAGLVTADAVNDLEKKGRPALDAVMAKSTTCSKAKLEVRREWYVTIRTTR
jgi:tyrosinase